MLIPTNKILVYTDHTVAHALVHDGQPAEVVFVNTFQLVFPEVSQMKLNRIGRLHHPKSGKRGSPVVTR